MGPKDLLDKITKFDSYKIIIGIPISERDLSGFPAHLQSRVQSLLAHAPFEHMSSTISWLRNSYFLENQSSLTSLLRLKTYSHSCKNSWTSVPEHPIASIQLQNHEVRNSTSLITILKIKDL